MRFCPWNARLRDSFCRGDGRWSCRGRCWHDGLLRERCRDRCVWGWWRGGGVRVWHAAICGHIHVCDRRSSRSATCHVRGVRCIGCGIGRVNVVRGRDGFVDSGSRASGRASGRVRCSTNQTCCPTDDSNDRANAHQILVVCDRTSDRQYSPGDRGVGGKGGGASDDGADCPRGEGGDDRNCDRHVSPPCSTSASGTPTGSRAGAQSCACARRSLGSSTT